GHRVGRLTDDVRGTGVGEDAVAHLAVVDDGHHCPQGDVLLGVVPGAVRAGDDHVGHSGGVHRAARGGVERGVVLVPRVGAAVALGGAHTVAVDVHVRLPPVGPHAAADGDGARGLGVGLEQAARVLGAGLHL